MWSQRYHDVPNFCRKATSTSYWYWILVALRRERRRFEDQLLLVWHVNVLWFLTETNAAEQTLMSIAIHSPEADPLQLRLRRAAVAKTLHSTAWRE